MNEMKRESCAEELPEERSHDCKKPRLIEDGSKAEEVVVPTEVQGDSEVLMEGNGTQRDTSSLKIEEDQSLDNGANVNDSTAANLKEESNQEKVRRRKVVLLLTYSGWGYLGMQRNPDAKTIEGELLQAMNKAGVITEELVQTPQNMLFQRAARTDKSVSAVKQIVSLKLPENTKIESINEHLPPQIRVVCMKRTTKGFNSKTNCDARTYAYVLPTFAFTPANAEPHESFRITREIIDKVNSVLKIYVGSHNFHNFTFKKSFKDASAKRFMHSFSCGEPFVRDGVEYIVLKVKGQSFMQHHIRKMIGLAIAVVRGYTTVDTVHRAFGSECLDIPKAPGLGLMLEEVHYERYNSKFGRDGFHETLDWSDHVNFLEEFKEEFILKNILKTEQEEKSMLTWLTTLPGHSYSVREDKPPRIGPNQSEEKLKVEEKCTVTIENKE